MKKYTIFVSVILLLYFTNGCFFKVEPNKAPEISVTSGGLTIPHTVGLNKWNGSVYDRQDTFIALMADKPDLPYLKLGSKIQIKFTGSSSPRKVEMLDFILKQDGTPKYGAIAVKKVPIKFRNGKAELVLDQNMAAMLSSNSKDYEKGGVLRGFRMTCTWGGNECEYAFIIRSDATVGN